AGMKILIREGSAAKNFDALIPLLHNYPNHIMFCSDDKHPDSLAAGHINELCARAIRAGIPLFSVLQAACINPILHYGMQVGMLREGDPADCILVNDFVEWKVEEAYINGVIVARNGISLIETNSPVDCINSFQANPITASDLIIPRDEYPILADGTIPVIEALDGQLITRQLLINAKATDSEWIADVASDILKIVVVNRYHPAPIAKAFVAGFGLTNGAIASSVAHDSHNIVAVGVDDASIAAAINLIISSKGGVSCVVDGLRGDDTLLELPIAGLMSAENGYQVADAYTAIDKKAKALGSKLTAPFMTLSFMCLLVIPHIKLSDWGLFNGDSFSFFSRTKK
ncbi:MAG: adenine deaminase, partial [Sediminibacterium sp.]|nr:adenine deaminase [Sediminibacterium sp.]